MKRITLFGITLLLGAVFQYGQSSVMSSAMGKVAYTTTTVSPATSPPPNRVANFSFETADSLDATLASSWQVLDQKYTRVNGPGVVWNGNYMLQLTAGAGAVERITLNQTAPLPVRMSAFFKGSGIFDDPNDKTGVSFDCKIAYRDGTFGFCPLTAKTKNVGTFDWTWVGYNTQSLSSIFQPIDWIELRLRMGNVPGTAWVDGVHAEEYNPTSGGMVTFQFDDSLLTTYTKAYPLLASGNFVGSVAAVTSYIGADSNHMTLEQHKDLQNHGWGVDSHTVSHADLTSVDLKKLNDELYWSQKYLVDNGFPTHHLILPFGAYTALVISRAEAERYSGYSYLSVRGTERGINPQGAFPYNIVTEHIESNTTVGEVKAWLSDTKGRRGWLVLLIHEIDTPNGIYTVDSATVYFGYCRYPGY